MDAETIQELKTLLEKERERLLAELKAIAKPDPRMKENWNADFPQFEQDEHGAHILLEEEADEVEEYETKLASEHSLESRLLAVNNALERIKDGTYGFCRKCKKEISLPRLKANPAADVCVEHSL